MFETLTDDRVGWTRKLAVVTLSFLLAAAFASYIIWVSPLQSWIRSSCLPEPYPEVAYEPPRWDCLAEWFGAITLVVFILFTLFGMWELSTRNQA